MSGSIAQTAYNGNVKKMLKRLMPSLLPFRAMHGQLIGHVWKDERTNLHDMFHRLAKDATIACKKSTMIYFTSRLGLAANATKDIKRQSIHWTARPASTLLNVCSHCD